MKRVLTVMCILITVFCSTAYSGGVIGLEKVDTEPGETANIGKLYVREVEGTYGDNCRFLLHSDTSDGSSVFADSAQAHEIIATGIAHRTAQHKFGSSSVYFGGTKNEILKIRNTKSALDLWGSFSDDWTLDFWVMHGGNRPAETYLAQYEGSTGWQIRRFYKNGQPGVFFEFWKGNFYARIGSWSTFSDTGWHHIALVKKGSALGLYVDGKQIGFGQMSVNANLTTDIFVGSTIGVDDWFSGFMDEIRFMNENIFGADPQSKLSNTFAVPAAPQIAQTMLQLFFKDDAGIEYKVKLEKQ